MRGKDLVGMPVVALDRGTQIEHVQKLIFDRIRNRVVGLLVDKGGWVRNACVVPLQDVHSFGDDAIVVPSASVIVEADRRPDIQLILERRNILDGTKLITSEGEEIGTIQDIRFDERTGIVEGFEVSSKMFADAMPGLWFLPVGDEVWVGENVAIVGAELARRLRDRENVGGSHHEPKSITERAESTRGPAKGKVSEEADKIKKPTAESGESGDRGEIEPRDHGRKSNGSSEHPMASRLRTMKDATWGVT